MRDASRSEKDKFEAWKLLIGSPSKIEKMADAANEDNTPENDAEHDTDSQIEQVDIKIKEIQQKDQDTHEALLKAMKATNRNVRSAQLRIKRLNGGLTKEEEVELSRGH